MIWREHSADPGLGVCVGKIMSLCSDGFIAEQAALWMN